MKNFEYEGIVGPLLSADEAKRKMALNEKALKGRIAAEAVDTIFDFLEKIDADPRFRFLRSHDLKEVSLFEGKNPSELRQHTKNKALETGHAMVNFHYGLDRYIHVIANEDFMVELRFSARAYWFDAKKDAPMTTEKLLEAITLYLINSRIKP